MQADELNPPFGIMTRAPGCRYSRAMNRDDEKRIAGEPRPTRRVGKDEYAETAPGRHHGDPGQHGDTDPERADPCGRQHHERRQQNHRPADYPDHLHQEEAAPAVTGVAGSRRSAARRRCRRQRYNPLPYRTSPDRRPRRSARHGESRRRARSRPERYRRCRERGPGWRHRCADGRRRRHRCPERRSTVR